MFYSIIWGVGRVLFALLNLKTWGKNNIPAQGGVIVAANHVSNWDPIVIALAFNRPIHFMGKAELFNNKLLALFFTKLNAFPVKRGSADRQAIKQAMQLIEEEKVLGIFPEGTRNKTGKEIKPQLGVALIALKTGAPVLPVACLGTKRNLPLGWFNPLEVRIGELIYLEEFTGKKVNSHVMAEVADIISDEINQLLKN